MSDYTDTVDDLEALYHEHHPQGRYPRHGRECFAPDHQDVCLIFRLAERALEAEKQLALLPRRGQSVLRGFVDGANDLGPRPSPQTAPRPPHPADWGVADREPRTGAERYFAEQMQAPDFRSGFEEETKALRSGPAVGSFDDDVVDAEIIED